MGKRKLFNTAVTFAGNVFNDGLDLIRNAGSITGSALENSYTRGTNYLGGILKTQGEKLTAAGAKTTASAHDKAFQAGLDTVEGIVNGGEDLANAIQDKATKISDYVATASRDVADGAAGVVYGTQNTVRRGVGSAETGLGEAATELGEALGGSHTDPEASFFRRHAGKLTAGAIGVAGLGGLTLALSDRRGRQSNAELYGQRRIRY